MPDMLTPKFEPGPVGVLRAVFTGDPGQIGEALQMQRELFRERFGCYPEECVAEELRDERYFPDVAGADAGPDGTDAG